VYHWPLQGMFDELKPLVR